METPPVAEKKSFNRVTKISLTPCRRLGLGRPSSGSSKKTHLVRTLSSPTENPNQIELSTQNKSSDFTENITTPSCEERLSFPLKDSNTHQKSSLSRSRRCLISSRNSSTNTSIPSSDSSHVAQDCNSSKKRKLNKKNVVLTDIQSNHSNNCINTDSKSNSVEVTREIIEQLVLSIKEKKKKLEQLQVQETYAKKHNLEELRQQTAKWRRVGQEALRYSLNLAKQAGYSITLKQLISEHGFLPHLIGYNSEDDELD